MSEHVASVISTGGGGGDFERRIGAYFLALLLTKSFVPIFADAAPTRVHFQARRLGWHIDDLVVEVRSEDGQARQIAAQIKRTFTLSAADSECRDTIAAAWRDFNNVDKFQQGHDAIVLITFLGTNRIQHDVRWLLTQARAAATLSDFDSRRAGQGTLSKQAKADYDTINEIIKTAQGEPVADELTWQFLRSFHVLSFDFQDSAAKDLALILSLLAVLRSPDTEINAASTTWSELVDLAGLAAGEGRSVESATLPAAMRARHSAVPTSKHRQLARLRQHSSVILQRLSGTGPQGLKFERTSIRSKLEAAAAAHRAVLLVGPAGSGKSVFGSDYIAGVARPDSNFVFAAEEFKAPHIDQVLAQANIDLSWQELNELLPLHRKTILVDGLERLLESSDRAAFKDLLLTVKQDETILLIVTCRDYYAELVERSLLATSGIDCVKVVVGGLTDEELDQTAQAVPMLGNLLSNPPLRALLRNPFLLARAAELRLQPSDPIPHNERALRKRMWGDLVRRDAYLADGMPAKRERIFFEVCVARARALQPFVAVEDVDGALGRLASDNLLAVDESGSRVAAAHDVLEDWGLAEWFTRRFDLHAGSAHRAAEDVGGHPALRRAYRKWLTEQLDIDASALNAFVAEACDSATLPVHFVDDTWLAIFQSEAANSFMQTFADRLLASEADWLKRLLHLVRVGCKTVSPLAANMEASARWHVPTGTAWAILLRFVHQHWTSLPSSIDALVANFIEDWAWTVSSSDPYPAGADSAGLLIENLLARRGNGAQISVSDERLIDLLLKIPAANTPLFEALTLRAARPGNLREDMQARHLAVITFKPFKSAAFARDFHARLIDLCLARWIEVEDDQSMRWSRELESVFGLTHDHDHRFFPPSALQGPFAFLLTHHLQDAVRFIVDFVNRCCTSYLNRSQTRQIIEDAYEVQLTLSDGRTRAVISNGRLWNAYRATSVVPGVIECALMALEARLLEMAGGRATPEVLQSYLNYILNTSNNVASIAVVASVCLAHPDSVGNCGVSVLGSPEFIRLDVARMVADQSALAVGGVDYYSQFFQKERMRSRELSHRARNLEWLAVQLQVGPERLATHALLDRYLSELPPAESRSNDQSQWTLALHRMDLRKYQVAQAEGGVELSMGPLPSDVNEMIESAQERQQEFIRTIRLQNWSHRRQEQSGEPDEEWRAIFELAKEVEVEIAARAGREILEGGGRMVAAIVLRDHWEDLLPADRQWCCETIEACLCEIPANGDIFRGSIPVDGSMECARALGAIAPQLPLPVAFRLLFAALAHFNRHVREAAVQGMADERFWTHPALPNFALNVLVKSAEIAAEHDAAHEVAREEGNWRELPSHEELFQQRQAQLLTANQEGWDAAPPSIDSHLMLHDWNLAPALVMLFKSRPDHPMSTEVFAWVAGQFSRWWDRHHEDRDSNYELHISARQAFAEFLLCLDEPRARVLLAPTLTLVDSEPDEYADLVEDMLLAADRRGDAVIFWVLWEMIAERAKGASWASSGLSDRSWGSKLVRKLLLNTLWRSGLRRWTLLGEAHRLIDQIFTDFPPVGVVLEAYCVYLLAVGADSLPGAVSLIHLKFGNQLPQALKQSMAAQSGMDQLASRLMFEHLPALQTPAYRAPMLAILDALIQAGSSNAFLLREDFVTPSGGAAR
jgi:hypothetical protein